MGTPPIASLQRLEDCKIGCNLCNISPMFGSTGWKVTTKGIRSLPADCLLLRVHCTAIGTKMAPSYANIFMGKLEADLLEQSPVKPHTWRRFIDDIFMIWTEGEERLKTFMEYMNSFHDTIKFTFEWSYTQVSFLDVSVMLDNGVISTDLYSKPTDKHQYLFHTSCHPNSCKKGIPFGQALRLRRICSSDAFFEKRAGELCNYLVCRGYNRDFVEKEIEKARRIPRVNTLSNKQSAGNERIPFVVTFHPVLPNIGEILHRLPQVAQAHYFRPSNTVIQPSCRRL